MIAGNFEDKYKSKNPISKILMKNFLNSFVKLLLKIENPKKIIELGAGEGELIKIISERFPRSKIYGSDISKRIIKKASENLRGKKVKLRIEDIHDLSYKDKSFDLVICCEVLEHLENPAKALKEINRVSKGKVILSVPLEPLWRILNMSRGKYLNNFGNTPGHLNHFNQKQFLSLVEKAGFNVISVEYPLPWQIVLLEKSKDLVT